MKLSEYEFELLRKDDEFALYRGKSRLLAPPTLLLLAPVSTHPALESLGKLEHEYALRNELDSRWAVQPIALSQHANQMALVLNDPGGEPLSRLISKSLDILYFLRIAIGLTNALGQLHKCGLLHRDVKPSNVMVDFATGRVLLTGFGVASRIPHRRQLPSRPDLSEGTLAYMAPEQSGRLNRSIDSRSDLYALGITLYEVLTGCLPFSVSTPMEWVHSHIARQPVPPNEHLLNVPAPVSAVLLKLLAKAAEERYQTADGVERDLWHCLNELESQERVDDFPLGAYDKPDRFMISQKLYGRRSGIEALFASFDRIAVGGRPELVLVSGYSGVGKSSIVNELHKSLLPARGLFASGKFDQYKRDVPYSTVAQALKNLIRPLLGKSESELRSWRDLMFEALGANGSLMVELVPELTLIIGEQPPVAELPPQDTQSRFQLTFRRFIGVFARPEHPLVLFLDDLQWLDSATLDLFENLLTHEDICHLMLIGAYRGNEVDSGHPLMRKLGALRRSGATVQELALEPLTDEDICQLLADSLHREPERVKPLAHLIHKKTGGNPFFAIQFIHTLIEEELLHFDYGYARWSWDLASIHAKGYTDNVADLMVEKLVHLPVETQRVLQHLACIGNRAEIDLLALVEQNSEARVHDSLREPIRMGFIYQAEGSYIFAHDRVQEAAYSLTAKKSQTEAHLRIGRLLAAHTPPEKKEEKVFEIVNQLNRGVSLITLPEERHLLAKYNFIAGKRAKVSAAFSSALNYFVAGSELLEDNPWQSQHDLVFCLELYRAECEFLTGRSATAEKRLNILSKRCANTLELAAVSCLLIDLYTTCDQAEKAIVSCLDYLQHLGVEWSPRPSKEQVQQEYKRIWTQIGNRAIEQFIDLPLGTDPEFLATLDVLTKVVPAAMFSDENFGSMAICRAVNLSLERGNSDGSSFAYVYLGMIAGPYFGNYEAGFRFGQLGYDLVEQRGLCRYQARTHMIFGSHVMPWTKHVQSCRDLVQKAFNTANEVGDVSFAAYSCNNMNTILLAAGNRLDEVQREAENGIAFAENARFGLVIDIITSQLALIRNLRGFAEKFGSLEDEHLNETRFEAHLASNPALALPECFYWIRKMQARFIAGNYADAVEASSKAQSLLWAIPSNFEIAEYHFYSALSCAALSGSATPEQAQQLFGDLTAHHSQLELWAENCRENFENRTALVGAEIARIEGRDIDAMRLYERAIQSAHTNGFVHNEAIAYETAARFYALRGFEKIADVYLIEARYCYLRWGAEGKVRQLNEIHPSLGQNPVAAAVSTLRAPVEQLDLASVIEASHAVSREMVLENLIEVLMRTAIEHAGAERGVLILLRNNEQMVEAEATTSGETVVVRLRTEPVRDAIVPESLIHYVVRTGESVILDDATVHNSFSSDTYIREHRARSILSLPLINQGKLIGVLYLENSLTSHVFTESRIAVLRLLASQAAISLQNAKLYVDLEQRERRIRRLVDANIMGVFIWDFEGRILEANEAFLDLLGFDREDLSAGRLNWIEMTPPDARERDRQEIAEIREIGTTQPFEKEYLRKDGVRVPVLLGAALFELGGSEGVAFVLDLSSQKRAADDLRRSQAYLTEAQRLAHMGSWHWSLGSGDISWSKEFLAIFGFDYAYDKLSYPTLIKRIHPEDRRKVNEFVRTAVREKKNFEIEYRLLLSEHTIKYLHTVGNCLTGQSGAIDFIGTVMDITERKRAEEERERLHQAQSDLAHINRVSTMGELTASLAHEIKQPIAAAVTNARTCARWLARDKPDLEEAKDAAARLIKDVARASDIINRVGSLFKKDVPQRELVDINELIQEMIVLLHGEAVRYSVVIATNLTSNLSQIMADRVGLQQVLMNLMVNAIEAMKGVGVGQLTITSQQGENGQLEISVRDTGVGLKHEQSRQIFDAFFTTKPGGTGMGLTISRSIIESHGGSLWATSNIESGATFKFTLPNGFSNRDVA